MQARGLVVLGVGRHRRKPEVLIAYLHGPAGQWVGGRARRVIAGIPGVLAVADSVPTPAIILIRVAITGDHDTDPGTATPRQDLEKDDVNTAPWRSLSGGPA